MFHTQVAHPYLSGGARPTRARCANCAGTRSYLDSYKVGDLETRSGESAPRGTMDQCLTAQRPLLLSHVLESTSEDAADATEIVMVQSEQVPSTSGSSRQHQLTDCKSSLTASGRIAARTRRSQQKCVTTEVLQRRRDAANDRERRRMHSLNVAFDALREVSRSCLAF